MDNSQHTQAPPDAGYQCVFTIFTPTFNRAHTLHRVYDSLRAQTFRDFEWLVIDDGSSDNTRELVESWKQQARFPVRYIHQPNQGKHVAHNRAVREARGEFLIPLDSDDACVPEALERLKYHWDRIPATQRHRFSAVTCHCIDERGRLVGTRFPQDVIDSDSLEIRYRHKVKGEKWGFQRVDVLRKFPFPEPKDVRFVTEGYVWRAIARQFKSRYINEVLRIYYCYDADQSLRLANRPRLLNVEATRLVLREVLVRDLNWFRFAPLTFVRDAAKYGRFAFNCSMSPLEQAVELKNFWARLLWFITLPIAYLYYVRDRVRRRA
jgi:glycosyltransferase involved in cell wall biosynthesis